MVSYQKLKLMSNLSKLTLLLAIVSMGIFSCNQQDAPIVTSFPVSFQFNHTVGTSPVQYDTIRYTNAFGNRYSVSTLQYFVSDIRMHRSDGTSFHFDMEHYVDGRDESTMTYNPEVSVPRRSLFQYFLRLWPG